MAAEYQLAHRPLSFWRLLPDWDFCHWWRSVFIHVCYRFTCHTEGLLHCIAFIGGLIKPRRNITGRNYEEGAYCWWMFEIRSMVSHYIYLLHTVGLTFVFCFFSNLLQSAVSDADTSSTSLITHFPEVLPLQRLTADVMMSCCARYSN